MAQIFLNNCYGKLAQSITATSTSITLSDTNNLPLALNTGDYFLLTLYQDQTKYGQNIEVVKVTAVSGSTLTIERGVEGTAVSHNIGERAEARLTAGSLEEINANLNTHTHTINEVSGLSGKIMNIVTDANGTHGVLDVNTSGAVSGVLDVGVVLNNKRYGGLQLSLADNTVENGNARGLGAIDLQPARLSADQVASGGDSSLIGGYANKATNTNSSVIGGNTNTASGVNTVVNGGVNNSASGLNSFSAGGEANFVVGVGSAVIAGKNNVNNGIETVIAGGHENTAEVGVTEGGIWGSEGSTLTANVDTSAVVGGREHTVSGRRAAVLAGFNNSVSGTYATVVGGRDNVASGLYSAVIGASNGTSSGESSVVFGGFENMASGNRATVLNGNNSTASGEYSLAGGWYSNATAYSAIALGYDCEANANYSFAHGKEAKAFCEGMEAFAYDEFADPGDAQTFRVVTRRAIAGGSIGLNALTLDDSARAGSNEILMPPDTVGNAQVDLILMSSTGHCLARRFRFTLSNSTQTGVRFLFDESETLHKDVELNSIICVHLAANTTYPRITMAVNLNGYANDVRAVATTTVTMVGFPAPVV